MYVQVLTDVIAQHTVRNAVTVGGSWCEAAHTGSVLQITSILHEVIGCL